MAGAVIGGTLWHLNRSSRFLYAGTVEATEVDIPSRVTSVLATVRVKEGDPVKKGQLLAELAGEDIKLAAEIAEKELQRAIPLRNSGSMNQESFDRIKYKRDDAVLRRSWCSVISPMDGTVLDTYFEAGEMVNPGATLMTLADLNDVWAVVYVPQSLISALSLGMTVEGYLPELDMRKLTGRVTHINSEAEFTPKNVQTRQERTRLVFGVKISFDNKDGLLKPGMTIEMDLPD